MANPYPALITDANSETRVAGQITFTDPSNQPGGASSPVLTHDTHLTSAQILALHDTAVEIIPNPGPGKMIGRAVVTFILHFGTTAYDDSLGTGFNYGPDSFWSVQFLLEATEDSFATDDVWASVANAPPVLPTSHWANVAWEMSMNANPTLGDGTLDVHVEYTVIDV